MIETWTQNCAAMNYYLLVHSSQGQSECLEKNKSLNLWYCQVLIASSSKSHNVWNIKTIKIYTSKDHVHLPSSGHFTPLCILNSSLAFLVTNHLMTITKNSKTQTLSFLIVHMIHWSEQCLLDQTTVYEKPLFTTLQTFSFPLESRYGHKSINIHKILFKPI